MNRIVQGRQHLFAAVAVAAVALLSPTTSEARQFGASLSGPVVGYVSDGHALRAIQGILGSATFGQPLDLRQEIDSAWTIDSQHVIGTVGPNRSVVTINLESAPVSVNALLDVPANPTTVAMSASAATAAFYYAANQQVWIVTGLPDKPTLSHQAGIPGVRGSLTRMAIADSGTLLLYAEREGDTATETVYRWTPSSDGRSYVTSANSISALLITPNGAAIVADSSANEIFAIWEADGAAIRQFLADSRDGVSNPGGAAFTSNGIYVANRGTAEVLALDLEGRIIGRRFCSCELAGLYPLRDSTFRLTDRFDQSLFILDATSSDPKFVFVPPAKD
jgi:hypothetical protein